MNVDVEKKLACVQVKHVFLLRSNEIESPALSEPPSKLAEILA